MCVGMSLCVRMQKFLRILTSDPGANASYANPSRALALFLLIAIDAPFPRTTGNVPMTLHSLTWDRPAEGCPPGSHWAPHRTTPPLWSPLWHDTTTEQLALSPCLPGGCKCPLVPKPSCLTGNSVLGFTHCTHATWSGQQGHSQDCGRDTHAGSACNGQTLPIDASHE